MSAKNSIILTVHNKETTIEIIMNGLLSTISADTGRIIVVLDGCTDASELKLKSVISRGVGSVKVDIVKTPDVWETLANNVGLRLVDTQFATIVQDDMFLIEENWDRKLINVFGTKKLFAVTGRTAHEFSLSGNNFRPLNLIGREFPIGSANLAGKLAAKMMRRFNIHWMYKFVSPVGVRLVANRGPLVLNMEFAKQLDFFDEAFAPFELDDVDLCCRAYKRFGLLCAARPIYYKEIGGSKLHSSLSSGKSKEAILKNTELLKQRHSDLERI